ncbi:MAG: MFS transporter [Acutalibacteraceae bacterium]|nr:MFS transporter [Acutalibacteraceae bacterium]
MANKTGLAQKAGGLLSDLKVYWKIPMPGRYMTFKEIAAYAGGGIGAYFIIYMGNALVVNINNMIVGGAIGVDPTHMYILYLIATLSNIPLTAIRANMIDNTRNKAGKYRPYLLSMGIPTVLTVLGYVYFPYKLLYTVFPNSMFGLEGGYIAKLIVVLIFNLLLQFFFNFFNDAYTNLIHVLSPNTQERTDVLAIKSVVYSLAPSIANIILPLISQFLTDNDLYDIKVYQVGYPIFAVIGVALTVVVFANTKEKIVQAKTRVVQVNFMDSFRSVAKNKYFWIIALAGWLGFLEGSYSNIMSWTYNYGHACEGSTMSLINTVVGNASMWGMIIAPFCIRAFGKKKVLVGINTMNIVCILAMGINKSSIWWLAVCVYFNWLFGAFEQITTPAIQADIRDYHQYKTGERVDGMFGTVQTIGNIVTLATSSVLPFVYKSYGIYEGNGYKESSFDILDVNTGKPGLLEDIIGALIIMAAVGAFLNLVPFFFYDLKETQHKSIIRILKIRAMFEDYGNGVTNDRTLVEAIDYIRDAENLTDIEPVSVSKKDKRADKKAYKEARKLNEEIAIAKLVRNELNKFSSEEYKIKLQINEPIYKAGLAGLFNADKAALKAELMKAKAMPKTNDHEKELRSFAIEVARHKLLSRTAIDANYKTLADFVQPDYAILESYYDAEESCDEKLRELYQKLDEAKKAKNKNRVNEIKVLIKTEKEKKAEAQKKAKAEMEIHAAFARAAKPYLDAEKMLNEKENYTHYEELASLYDEAKARNEAEDAANLEAQKKEAEEKQADKARRLAEKQAKKKIKK